MAKAFTEDQQAVYLQRVGEIEPNIRYCAYNIGDDSALKDLMQMRREAGGDFMTGELDVSRIILKPHRVRVMRGTCRSQEIAVLLYVVKELFI